MKDYKSFWIQLSRTSKYQTEEEVIQKEGPWGEKLHVIEYSAYEALQEKIETVIEAYQLKDEAVKLYKEAISDLQAENKELKTELKILKNPSDGRCMEIMTLREHNKRLREALEFYATGRHMKKETIRGRIIEFDPDAGPLYETYEEYTHNEYPVGKTARQALNGGTDD